MLLVKVKTSSLGCYSVYKLCFHGHFQSLEGHIHTEKHTKSPWLCEVLTCVKQVCAPVAV